MAHPALARSAYRVGGAESRIDLLQSTATFTAASGCWRDGSFCTDSPGAKQAFLPQLASMSSLDA
jgi:hypothetical protein